MINVTITVPEEMKTKMDKYSDVSWSEICRNAISKYIAQRENPKPIIDLEQRLSRINHYDHETGYASLTIDLRIGNRMSSEIIVDRILATARTQAHDDGKTVIFGEAYDLRRKTIDANAVGGSTLRFSFPREKLLEFKDRFTKTFDCTVKCLVFVDGFKDAYWQEFFVLIPIDLWNRTIDQALERGRENQATA